MKILVWCYDNWIGFVLWSFILFCFFGLGQMLDGVLKEAKNSRMHVVTPEAVAEAEEGGVSSNR